MLVGDLVLLLIGLIDLAATWHGSGLARLLATAVIPWNINDHGRQVIKHDFDPSSAAASADRYLFHQQLQWNVSQK